MSDWQRVLLLERELSRLLVVSKMFIKLKKNTELLGDVEFLSSCSTQCLSRSLRSSWDIELNTRREIPYRPARPCIILYLNFGFPLATTWVGFSLDLMTSNGYWRRQRLAVSNCVMQTIKCPYIGYSQIHLSLGRNCIFIFFSLLEIILA